LTRVFLQEATDAADAAAAEGVVEEKWARFGWKMEDDVPEEKGK
jgi:hypothetical protein